MKTFKIPRNQVMIKWRKLESLAVNGNVPDNSAHYGLTRAYQKSKEAYKPYIDGLAEIEKKFLERNEKGDFTGAIKKEYTPEGYEKAIKDYESGDPIEVEVYQIKLSGLKNATITNIMGKEISIPPATIAELIDIYIIDDFTESLPKEKKKVDIPPQPSE